MSLTTTRGSFGAAKEASMSNEPVYPSVKQGVLMCLVCISAQLILGCVIGVAAVAFSLASGGDVFAFLEEFGDDLLLASVLIGNILILGGVFFYGYKKSKAPLRSILPMKRIRPFLYMPMAGLMVGMGILFSQLDNFYLWLLEWVAPEWLFKMMEEPFLGDSESSLWVVVLLFVIVAPVTEEPLFRGLLLRGFLSHRSRWRAVWISALLFGALHMNIRQFAPAVALGIVFAWWRIETGSLLPALFGHALYNACAVGYWLLSNAGMEFETLQPLWLNAAGGLFFVWGLLSLRRYFQELPADERYAENPPP